MKIEDFDTQWAILQENDIFIGDSESGRKKYSCIGCGQALEAVKQHKNPHHKSFFRHYDVDKDFHCSLNGRKYLEKIVEQIIINNSKIKLPPLFKYPPKNKNTAPVLLQKEKILIYSIIKPQITFFIDEEGNLKSGANQRSKEKNFYIRPDLTIYNEMGDPILFIEIVITNPISDKKKAKLIAIGIDTVQIELKATSREELEKIIDSAINTKWVYSNEEFRTSYSSVSNETEGELYSTDEEQKKLFSESLACRRSRIRNLIQRIKDLLETEQYRKIKTNLQTEVDRIERLRKSAESRLGEMETEEERRINSDIKKQERELRESEKVERQRGENIRKRYSDLEGRYNFKREKLEEEESTIRSKERREFESEEPLKYLPNRIESLSGDIRRFKDKRKFEESGNDTVIQEERRIDVQLAEFDRIETRLEL